MKLVHSITELQETLEAVRETKTIVFVPTMGALHEGHISLIEEARRVPNSFVVLSIFVNPTQFGKGEDYDKYPRTLESDLVSLEAVQPDLVFAPAVDEVYANGIAAPMKPRAGALGAVFEGASRPGHFEGMLHIVSWFFELIKPKVAVFGAKDAQQLFLIKRMIHREFADSIEIIEAETVREEDLLARSSRNRFLSPEARAYAPELFRALLDIQEQITNPSVALSEARGALTSEPLAKLDYLALVDKRTFAPIDDDFTGEAQLLVASVVSGVRLIDNLTFYIQEPA